MDEDEEEEEEVSGNWVESGNCCLKPRRQQTSIHASAFKIWHLVLVSVNGKDQRWILLFYFIFLWMVLIGCQSYLKKLTFGLIRCNGGFGLARGIRAVWVQLRLEFGWSGMAQPKPEQVDQ